MNKAISILFAITLIFCFNRLLAFSTSTEETTFESDSELNFLFSFHFYQLNILVKSPNLENFMNDVSTLINLTKAISSQARLFHDFDLETSTFFKATPLDLQAFLALQPNETMAAFTKFYNEIRKVTVPSNVTELKTVVNHLVMLSSLESYFHRKKFSPKKKFSRIFGDLKS